MGTWNVLSLGEQGSDILVAKELDRLNLSITALTEVRWPASGSKSAENSTFLWSGRTDNKKLEGVAFVLSWSPINERILTASFKHQHGRIRVIVCYAPTNSH